MPLLACETFLFPEDLLGTSDESEAEAEIALEPWWALYTLSRNEKALMRKLRARELRFYCPVVRRCHHAAGGGRRTSHVPLFSNYVFLQGDEMARYAAVCTGHVSRYMPIQDAGAFVRQMRAIHRMIDAGVPVDLEHRLVPGRWVRITNGPLKGIEGEIRQARNRMQFVVNVAFLGQGVSTIVEGWDLEPVL
jgi:transcriptional antiterminator RfaH